MCPHRIRHTEKRVSCHDAGAFHYAYSLSPRVLNSSNRNETFEDRMYLGMRGDNRTCCGKKPAAKLSEEL
jgi:hypothetical protein